MTLFGDIVSASQRIGATAARLGKVRELASLLRTLAVDEIETSVHYLSGEIPQGRIGIGYLLLKAAAGESTPEGQMLSIAEVDRCLTMIAAIRGKGSAGRRAQALKDLFSRATSAEQA